MTSVPHARVRRSHRYRWAPTPGTGWRTNRRSATRSRRRRQSDGVKVWKAPAAGEPMIRQCGARHHAATEPGTGTAAGDVECFGLLTVEQFDGDRIARAVRRGVAQVQRETRPSAACGSGELHPVPDRTGFHRHGSTCRSVARRSRGIRRAPAVGWERRTSTPDTSGGCRCRPVPPTTRQCAGGR